MSSSSILFTLVKELNSSQPNEVTRFLINAKYSSLREFSHFDGDIEEPEEEEERDFLRNMTSLGQNEVPTLLLLRKVSQKCLEWVTDGCEEQEMVCFVQNLIQLSSSISPEVEDHNLLEYKKKFPLSLLFALSSDESFSQWSALVVSLPSPRKFTTKKSLRHGSVQLKKWVGKVWYEFDVGRKDGFETASLQEMSNTKKVGVTPVTTTLSSFQGSSYPLLQQKVAKNIYDVTFIEALFTHGGSVAGSLIRCAYYRHIRYPPSPQTFEIWIRAVQYREAGDDQSADMYVQRAFEIEFWLPLRYAALFSFKPNFPILLPRIEYEAVLTIASIQRNVIPDDVFNVVSSQCGAKTCSPENVNSTIWWNKTCAHCMQPGRGCHNFVPCGTPICSMKHRVTYEHDIPNMSILPENPCDWDPSIWAIGILYWKLPDNNFYFEKNASTDVSFGIDKFETTPPELEQIFISIRGEEVSGVIDKKEDVYHITRSIYDLRNNSFRTSKPITLVDSWVAISRAISFCHVAKRQAEKWSFMSGMGGDIPPENAINELGITADSALRSLYATLPKYIPQLCGNLLPEFDKFTKIFNGHEDDAPISILLCPPDNQEGYAGSFAGFPWTSVLDLSDSSFSVPSLWSTLADAIGQGTFRPGCHNHLRWQTRVRGQADESMLDALIQQHTPMSPVGLPWFQPLLQASGEIRAAFFHHLSGQEVDVEEIRVVKREIRCVADALIRKAITSMKDLLVVLPLHGLYNYPFVMQNRNTAFLKEVSETPVMNYSFGPFAQEFLQSITAHTNNDVHIEIILLLDSVTEDNSTCVEWVKTSVNLSSCDITPLRIPPHLFDIMFDSKLNDSRGMRGKCVRILAGNEEFPLSMKHRPFDSICDDGDGYTDVSIDTESMLNLAKLRNAGLELLYLGVVEDILKDTSRVLMKSVAAKLGAGDDHTLPSLYKNALDFAAGEVASWSLFDKRLTDQYNMSSVVILRDISNKIEQEAFRLWRHAGSHHVVNLLSLVSGRGQGATTLCRRFAYEVAFKSWGAAVFNLSAVDGQSTAIQGVGNLLDLCQAVASANEADGTIKPLVFIADRMVSHSRVLALLAMLKLRNSAPKPLCALMVLVQGEGAASTILRTAMSPTSKFAEVVIPRVDSNECHAIRAVVKSLCGEDLDAVAGLNQFAFRRVHGLIQFGAGGDSQENVSFRNAHDLIIGSWVNDVVDGVYNLIDENSARRPALMSLLCVALVQLNWPNCSGFSPASLLPILESPDAQCGLYDNFQVLSSRLCPLEENVLRRAYSALVQLQQQHYQSSCTLIPFMSMFESSFAPKNFEEVSAFSVVANQITRIANTCTASAVSHLPAEDQLSFVSRDKCVMESIAGDLKTTAFGGPGSSPANEVDDLVNVFLTTDAEGRIMFISDVIAERVLDACMTNELEQTHLHKSQELPSPYFMLLLRLSKCFKDHPSSSSMLERYGDFPRGLDFFAGRKEEMAWRFKHVFVPSSNASSCPASFSWAINRINTFRRNPVDYFLDNKPLLALLSGVALFPKDASIHFEVSKLLHEPNWSKNICDDIEQVTHSFAQHPPHPSAMCNLRLLLCTGLSYLSMSYRFGETGEESSEVPAKMMLSALDVLNFDAKCVISSHEGIPNAKASALAAMPSTFVEASSDILPSNELSFLLNYVVDVLLFSNMAAFFERRSGSPRSDSTVVFVRHVFEGLQEVLSLLGSDSTKEEWVIFYRLLLLHDFTSFLDKQKKKYSFCDQMLDRMEGGVEFSCLDDLLLFSVDVVESIQFSTPLVASDVMEHLFFIETLPFTQGNISYQNTFRDLFHMERLSLDSFSDPLLKKRAMVRLARIAHWSMSSSHIAAMEPSRLMKCLVMESPEFAGELPAVIKCMYESATGPSLHFPFTMVSDIIEMSTFSNRNEAGYSRQPISNTDVEFMLKGSFQRLQSAPTSSPTQKIAKRNYLACVFVELWGLCFWRLRHGIHDNLLIKNALCEFIKWNGTFSEEQQCWLSAEDSDGAVTGIADYDVMDELVFTRPGDVAWTDSGHCPPKVPSLLRRRFDDIEEADVELGEDELFLLQAVYGRVVFVKTRSEADEEEEDFFSGYISLEGIEIYLPFSIPSEYEYGLLDNNGKAPYLFQRCSFYVSFKCGEVYAFSVQGASDDQDRISMYDILHAERIAMSNNSFHQPRIICERPFRPRVVMQLDRSSFMDYDMSSSGLEVPGVFDLSDTGFSDLLKDFKSTASVPIQLMSSREFSIDNVAGMVNLQKHIYGRLNFPCTALHTPYESFDVLPNRSTGWIAVPVNQTGVDPKCVFPWIEKNSVDPLYLDKQIHWVARDVVSLFVDKALKFGGSKPSKKVEPQGLDMYESATDGSCRRMFLFMSLPKLSLVGVPQGIVVLREQPQSLSGHFFDLGILFFENMTTSLIRNSLITIWRRSVGCILNSNWPYLRDVNPSTNDSVQNVGKRVLEEIEEVQHVGVQPFVASSTAAMTPLFNGNMNNVAPSLGLGKTAGGGGLSTNSMSFPPPTPPVHYFMDMNNAPSVVEPLFPTSNLTSQQQEESTTSSSYLGIIGQGSPDPQLTPPQKSQPGSFASVLAEGREISSDDISLQGSSSKMGTSEYGNSTSSRVSSKKPLMTTSLDGRHGDYKVFVKNLKDFSVSQIQEILGNDVRSVTLKLTNKQPNGMCHVTFRTKNGYLTALNRNYELISPSINLSISKDTSNDSKFNIDNPVYCTYGDDDEFLCAPSSDQAVADGGEHSNVLASSLSGEHGDFYAFVRGLFYYNSYEVQSFLGDDVRSVTLKMDEEGNPNGMSHVTFHSLEGFNAAISRNNEYIRGKQQLRIAPDTKKDFANGSCRTVYFIRPLNEKAKERKKLKSKKVGTKHSGVSSTTGGRKGGGNVYDAFGDDED